MLFHVTIEFDCAGAIRVSNLDQVFLAERHFQPYSGGQAAFQSPNSASTTAICRSVHQFGSAIGKTIIP
jgi:hypothetical protein